MFLQELKKFSKQNWWVYLLLIIASSIVYKTWKWDLVEILILFFANFLWNLFIMVMQSNYTAKKNKFWAIYQFSSTIIFTIIAIYSLFKFHQYQYIIWQLCYFIAAIKAFTFYNFWKNIKFFNAINLFILNIILFSAFIYVWLTNFASLNINIGISSILMWIWFSLVTTWLVSTNDKFRYWLNLFWIIWIISGSFIWVINSYFAWEINWVDLWYFILTSTVFVFYAKLLPNYIKLKK